MEYTLVMVFLLVLAFICFPAALIALAKHQRWAQRVGVILLCYLLGLLIGGAGLLPPSFNNAQQSLMSAAIALAIPLLLFGSP